MNDTVFSAETPVIWLPVPLPWVFRGCVEMLLPHWFISDDLKRFTYIFFTKQRIHDLFYLVSFWIEFICIASLFA